MNYFYQVMYEMLVLLLPFITSPYIARVVGKEGLGEYTFSYSVAYFFVLFANLGIKNYGNRIIAKSRDDQKQLNMIFTNVYFVHFIASIFSIGCYVIYVLIFAVERLYCIIQIFYVISVLFDVSWFYFGIERFKLTVARDTFIKLMTVVLIFLCVKNRSDLWIYCLIMAGGQFASQLFLWVPLRKYVSFVKPNMHEMMLHIRPLFVLFIPAVAVSLYKYMDKIMIGTLSDKAELGIYENAEKVVNIPLTIIGSFGTVMLPRMSNLFSNDKTEQVKVYISSSMKYVMCLAMALSFGLAAVGMVFAPVFWGEDFYFSGRIIMELSVTVPFIAFANVIRTQFLIPNEKDKEYLSSILVGALLNILFNMLYIPKMGAAGAALGTIVAEISVCIVQCFVVRKKLPLYSYLKKTIPYLIIGILMFVCVFKFGSLNEANLRTLLIQIVIGVGIYSSLIFLLFYFTNDALLHNLIKTLGYKIRRK
jgi:O-antigen/teichoic acid export membrane protein